MFRCDAEASSGACSAWLRHVLLALHLCAARLSNLWQTSRPEGGREWLHFSPGRFNSFMRNTVHMRE